MKKLLASAVLVLSLVGCATPLTNYQPSVKQISEPPLNSINTAYIGDRMLRQGRVVEQEALYMPSTVKHGMGYMIHQGYFPKRGESDEYIQYSISNKEGAGRVENNQIVSEQAQALVLRKSDNAICILTITNLQKNCTTGVAFEKRNWATADVNSFQQTLIYNGKVGSKINIGYREFAGDMARSAFSNQVEYDLNDSSQIGYKGALLDIIDANNQMIKYKVLKNFNTQ